ncbi:helix-turn-helix transcriptional regulator [Streptomyces pimonensis]|uniref:Helix-turn-helix transcriptional regulator n=1 Tax=Streptomyces pimonensis TaxID=2860288 RepID=A0ABV4J5I3_9ACTN
MPRTRHGTKESARPPTSSPVRCDGLQRRPPPPPATVPVRPGSAAVHPGAVNALIHDHRDLAWKGRALPARAVTGREEEILELVAEGRTSQQIAGLLVIGSGTVERHRADLPAELGLKDRLELTRYAVREGLVEP